MEKAIRTVFYFGPLIFGFGFLVPLITQSLIHLGYPDVLGISAFWCGLFIGGGYALFAQITGRWI